MVARSSLVRWVLRLGASAALVAATCAFQVASASATVSVANPGINPNLVTLPDSGDLPAAFDGSNYAWFGDTTSGTFCGADWNTNANTGSTNTSSSKTGCTSREAFSGTLTSPAVSLAGSSSATLTFYSWWEIEGVAPTGFDTMTVEYSSDGGATWNPLSQLNPTSSTSCTPSGSLQCTGDQSYSNNGLEASPSWQQYSVDLSPALSAVGPGGANPGNPIQLRFNFNTVDSNYNGFRGWGIDDVAVTAATSSPSTVLSEGWESGLDGWTVADTSGDDGQTANDPHWQVLNNPPPPPPTAPPAATTGAPSVSSSTGAGFSGSVNPEGLPTTAHFEYGLDPKYSGSGGPVQYTSATPDQSVGSDFSSHPVTATVSGLVPNALYHVRLVATNSQGTTDGPDMTFTTLKDPPPPPPVLGKSFDASVVSGLVFIQLPNSGAGDSAHATFTKGTAFVPLTEARQLPAGTRVDARLGKLKMTNASTKHGKLQNGTFNGGIWSVSQSKSGLTKGLTTLSIVESAFTGAPTYSSCKSKAADTSPFGAFAASGSVLQTLHSSAKGRYRTRGHYASATVRGTGWTISDRCDGTLVTVQRHSVSVQDFVRHVTVVVRQGHRYLAKAPKKH